MAKRSGKPSWGVKCSGKHRKATGSNPSAVTDGKSVFVYFKSGDLACLDFKGKTVWHVNLQKDYGERPLWWGTLGTSPVLTNDCVVVAVMHSGPSYLAGFDKKSGKEKWKAERDLAAPMEAAQKLLHSRRCRKHGGEQTIYVLGADHVTAHRGDNGQELWHIGGLNPNQEKFFRSIASPVVIDDMIIAPYARGGSLTAMKTGGRGDVTKTNVEWFKDDLGADVPTPAAHAGRVYVCRDREQLVCLDAKSGKEIWRQTLEKHRSQFSSSPILAGGKIYVTREDGKTFVVEQQGDTPKLVASNELNEEPVVATPVFVDGRILLRTPDHLYAIGK